MVFGVPAVEKLVHSEFANRLIPIYSEAWRHECEVAFYLGLPKAKREEMLEGSADGSEPGVKQLRGAAVANMLREEIGRLAEIRCRNLIAGPIRASAHPRPSLAG
jgi:hypothetical protein